MKKLMIVLALLASVQVANAQGGAAAAKKAVDAALAATQNAKKATKVALPRMSSNSLWVTRSPSLSRM